MVEFSKLSKFGKLAFISLIVAIGSLIGLFVSLLAFNIVVFSVFVVLYVASCGVLTLFLLEWYPKGWEK